MQPNKENPRQFQQQNSTNLQKDIVLTHKNPAQLPLLLRRRPIQKIHSSDNLQKHPNVVLLHIIIIPIFTEAVAIYIIDDK